MTTRYVVAWNQKEANELVDLTGHKNYQDAVKHLKEVQLPPTDPYYGQKYKIFKVVVKQ